MTAVGERQVPCLMYHQIATRSECGSALAVAPTDFAAQIGYLRAEGYRGLTGSEVEEIVSGRIPEPERGVALTFDDGYADFYDRAMSVLTSYGLSATVFVATGWVEDCARPATKRRPGRMLSWRQIEEMAAAGIEIGSHSHGHPQLDQVSTGRLREELGTSKRELEQRLGREIRGLAYPYGYSNARVRAVAGEVGYGYAFAVGNAVAGAGWDRLALPRLTVRRSTGMPTFHRMFGDGRIGPMYLRERALTKGWALVRRTRAAVGGVGRAV